MGKKTLNDLLGNNEAIIWTTVKKKYAPLLPLLGLCPLGVGSEKSGAFCQVPVKPNNREGDRFGLSSSSSGGRLVKTHSAL